MTFCRRYIFKVTWHDLDLWPNFSPWEVFLILIKLHVRLEQYHDNMPAKNYCGEIKLYRDMQELCFVTTECLWKMCHIHTKNLVIHLNTNVYLVAVQIYTNRGLRNVCRGNYTWFLLNPFSATFELEGLPNGSHTLRIHPWSRAMKTILTNQVFSVSS